MTANEYALVLERLGEIISRLARIEKKFDIVPDKEIEISSTEESIQAYEKYARKEIALQDATIENHVSVIQAFLLHSKGVINKDSIKAYLDSKPSPSWKANQIKALRRYIRDFLKLGNWIEEFQFEHAGPQVHKRYPTNEELATFYGLLPRDSKPVFLVLLASGLRLGEILGLRIEDIKLDLDSIMSMVDASKIHQGKTKHSWVSFVTNQASWVLLHYLGDMLEHIESKAFPLPGRTIQEHFSRASGQSGIEITPKLLRKVFADRCERAGINKKYIDAFCGRTPKGVLASNYTDYSPEKLGEEYEKVIPFLTLDDIDDLS